MTSGPFYFRRLNKIVIYAGSLLSFILLALTLNITNPLESGPVVILLVFVLFYLFTVSLLALITHTVGAVVRMVRPRSVFSLKKWYYTMSIVALVPVLLVALNTLGQLKALEISLIFLLIALGCFYVVRRSK